MGCDLAIGVVYATRRDGRVWLRLVWTGVCTDMGMGMGMIGCVVCCVMLVVVVCCCCLLLFVAVLVCCCFVCVVLYLVRFMDRARLGIHDISL